MDYLKLAQVLKPQGIKGELKLKAFTDDLARFSDLAHLYFKSGENYICYKVDSSRTYKNFVYVKLKEINSIEQAETLRNKFLYIDRDNAAKLPEGSDYIADIIGCAVYNESKKIGVVKEIINNGAGDIYVLTAEQGEIMFPAAPGVITLRDVKKKLITVDPKRFAQVALYD